VLCCTRENGGGGRAATRRRGRRAKIREGGESEGIYNVRKMGEGSYVR